MEKTTIEKATGDIVRIYTGLQDLYKKYEMLISDYHKIAKTNIYSEEHKENEKAKALEKIEEARQNYLDTALEQLEGIEGRYTPKEELKELSEIEVLTKVMLYKDTLNKLPKDEFQAIYKDYKHNEDIKTLFNNVSREDDKLGVWVHEVDNPKPTHLGELIGKERKMLESIKNSIKSHITVVCHEGEFMELRDIQKDLQSHEDIEIITGG